MKISNYTHDTKFVILEDAVSPSDVFANIIVDEIDTLGKALSIAKKWTALRGRRTYIAKVLKEISNEDEIHQRF